MGLTNNTGKLSNTLTSNGTQITLGGSTVTDGQLLNIIGNQSSVNVGVVLNNTNGTYPRIYALQNVNNNLTIYDYTANASRLTISSTGAATFSSTSGIGVTIVADWNRSATNDSQLYIKGATNGNKQLRIGYDTTGNVGYIQALTSGTSVDNLLINPSGGRVGIGQAAPGVALSVAGQTENWQLALTSVTGTAGAVIGSPSANVLAFGDWSGTERMRITSEGNLLINKTSQSNVKFYVRSSTQTSSDYAIYADNSVGDLFAVRNDGLFQTGNRANSPYNANISGRSAVIDSSGTLGYTSSTRESKTNIKSISDINWLKDLNPVSFNYRKKENYTTYTEEYFEETAYGFIADEVEKVNADFVFYNTDEENNKKLAGVEYNHLIAVLVKGYQEQQTIIDGLKADIELLKNK